MLTRTSAIVSLLLLCTTCTACATGSPPVGLIQDRSESFTKIVPTNFLIGPSAEDLVFYGAYMLYAVCCPVMAAAAVAFGVKRNGMVLFLFSYFHGDENAHT